jgi:Centromere DNA-binding protein complex CBF3 subunit B
VVVKHILINGDKRISENSHQVPSNDNPLLNADDLDSYSASVQILTQGYADFGNQEVCTHGNNWINFGQDLSKILDKLDYETSSLIVKFSCTKLNFIHNGISPTVFLNEHDKFWQTEVSDDRNSLNYWKQSKMQSEEPRDYYYWMALYYVVLCSGLYFCPEEEFSSKLPFSSADLQILPRTFFLASYDCLHRADFMNAPDIRAIQVYCAMSICFHGFAGIHLHNCLLTNIIYIARYLGLDKITSCDKTVDFDVEMSTRLWYMLCVIDWMSNSGRSSVIHISEMKSSSPLLVTNEILGQIVYNNMKYPPSDFVAMSSDPNNYSDVTFEIYLLELAKIKRSWYFERSTELALQQADRELSALKYRYETEFCSILKGGADEPIINGGHRPASQNQVVWGKPSPAWQVVSDLDSYAYARFLLEISIQFEMVEVSRRFLPFIGLQQWSETHRRRCIDCSLKILKCLTEPDIPPYFNRMWIVVNHAVNVGIFLLLDILMFRETVDEDDYRLVTIKENLPAIEKLMDSHVASRVGFAIIKKLLYIVNYVSARSNGDQQSNVEEMSLKHFLKDLKIVKRVGVQGRVKVSPDTCDCGKYFKARRDESETQTVFDEAECFDRSAGNFFGSHSLCDIPELVNNSGWVEFLNWVSTDHFTIKA